MILSIVIVITTTPQSPPKDVPVERVERWQDVACSDACCVFFLFVIIFVISSIITVVVCFLQKPITVVQMFEFGPCQHYGDNFTGPVNGINIGGTRNQNTSIT